MPHLNNKQEEKDTWEDDAVNIVNAEKNAWEQERVNVSSAAHFTMRSEIDNARKNYYGIYDNPTDRDSGLDKLWVPLTEWTVETSVRNTDVDQKDVRIKSVDGKNPEVARVMRLLLNNYFNKIGFGEFLNDSLRRMHIDGTLIVKAIPAWNKEFKKNMTQLSIVDPLNFIIDPSVHSIQDGPVTERFQFTRSDVMMQDDWMNRDQIQWSDETVPKTEVFERWGPIQRRWDPKFTGTVEKGKEWVEGRIVTTGAPSVNGMDSVIKNTQTATLSTNPMTLQMVEINKRNIKPYEEAWLKRVPARWHGRGIPEQIRALQTYMNTVINIRRDEALNKLGGKYKVRQGSGITKQMLSSLKSGGVIEVDELDDIAELAERDIKPSAYQEPNEILQMVDRVTGTSETSRGESPLASQTATATLAVEKGSKGASVNIQENYGLFLERLLGRHVIPLELEHLKEGEVVRVTGELSDLEAIDKAYVKFLIDEASTKAKRPITFIEQNRIRKEAEAKLRSLGKDRFVEVARKVFQVNFDVEVNVSENRITEAVVIRQLQDLIFGAGKIPEVAQGLDLIGIVKEQLDLMGLSGTRFTKAVTAPAPQAAQNPGSPQGASDIVSALGQSVRANAGASNVAGERV